MINHVFSIPLRFYFHVNECEVSFTIDDNIWLQQNILQIHPNNGWFLYHLHEINVATNGVKSSASANEVVRVQFH